MYVRIRRCVFIITFVFGMYGHADHLRTDAPRDTPPHADTAHAPHTHARSGLWSLIIITCNNTYPYLRIRS